MRERIIWCKDCKMELEIRDEGEEEDSGVEVECLVCPDCGGELTDEDYEE